MNNFLMKLFRCWWRGHIPTPPMIVRETHVRIEGAGHLKAWHSKCEITQCYFCDKILSRKPICNRPKITVEMLEE